MLLSWGGTGSGQHRHIAGLHATLHACRSHTGTSLQYYYTYGAGSHGAAHLRARDHLVLPSQDVHQLALTLITPLRAQHHGHL